MIKFKSIILLLAAIQLFSIKSTEAVTSNKTLKAKSDLVHFYEAGINNLSINFCKKFQIISARIVKDPTVKHAKTPIMQQLKGNMTQYQEMYPIYTRLNLHKPLLSFFTQHTIKYYYQNDKSSQYILKLLTSLGYNEVIDQFEKEFMKFISTGFLYKFEQFKNILTRNETKEWQELLHWGQKLKDCKSYECVYKSFIHFDKIILTPKEQFFAYINRQLRDLSLYFGNGTYTIAKNVINNPKISQLSVDIRQKLKRNLGHFIRLYENNQNVSTFNKMFEFLHRFVLLEFLDNKNISAEDAKLLNEIFGGKGYAQFERNYINKLKHFVEIDLINKMDYFSSHYSRKMMIQEKKLFETLNHIKRLNSPEEKRIALAKLVNDYYGVPKQ